MNAAARLGLFGVGLVAVFGIAVAASGAFAPEGVAAEWTAAEKEPTMQDHTAHAASDESDDHSQH